MPDCDIVKVKCCRNKLFVHLLVSLRLSKGTHVTSCSRCSLLSNEIYYDIDAHLFNKITNEFASKERFYSAASTHTLH